MGFANQTWLWALTALSLPIAIHLLSKKEGKVIKIGSVRHLSESTSQQFKSLRLNELVLLALRCALLIVMSLLLSGLLLQTSESGKWVIVEPGLRLPTTTQNLADSLLSSGEFELHYLTSGFPKVYTEPSNSTNPNYWHLVTQLKIIPLERALVFSRSRISHFKGERTTLPPSIQWITVPSEESDFLISALRFTTDSIRVVRGRSNEQITSFEWQEISWPSAQSKYFNHLDTIQILTPVVIHVSLVADNNHDHERKLIRAALETIAEQTRTEINIHENKIGEENTTQHDSSEWLFWLADKAVPAGLKGNIISLDSSTTTTPYKTIHRKNTNHWVLSSPVTTDIILHSHFLFHLTKLLLPQNKQNEIININDQRTMPDRMMWSKSNEQLATTPTESKSTEAFLFLLFILILLTERSIAYRRNA